MDLLDLFGGSAADPNDPQSLMLAQLGADPTAIRRQSAMQSLGSMGAAMLANSGPSTQRKSLASILGQGMQAGQQSYADNTSQQLNHLYVLENMKRAAASDKRTESQDALDAMWRKNLANPEWIKSNVPESVQPYMNIVAGLPMQQGTQILLQAQRDKTAQDKLDAADKKPRYMSGPNGAIFAIDPSTNAAQELVHGKAEYHDPGELSKTVATMRALGIPDAQIRETVGAKVAGAPHEDAFTKADEQSAVKEASRLQDAIPLIQDALNASNEMIKGLTPDEAGRMRFGDTGRIAAWKASQPEGSLFGGTASLTPDQQLMQKLATRATLRDIPNLKTRITNFELQFLNKGNPGLANDPATNRTIAQGMRDQQAAQLALMQKRLDYIQQNKSLSGLTPDYSGAQGSAASSGGGGSRPAGLPATAKQGTDGRWYDPATGRPYVEVP